MDANRKTAYLTLMAVEQKKAYSNIALNHQIIVGKPTSEAFVRELVYGVLENKIWLDYILEHLIPSGVESVKTSDLTILRMGIYQLGYMDSVPEYAAVNESVVLAKRFARGRSGFINGVLRSYIRERYNIKLPDRFEDEVKYLSIKYSYDPWIISLWMEQYDSRFVEELLEAGNQKPPMVIRMNWLKVVKRDLIARLEKQGFEVSEGKLCDDSLYIKGSGLINNQLYRNGMYSVQDEAALLVANMLDPKQGDLIMDLCAAPGGKTMAIAERMNNRGKIIASDIYKRKLNIVEQEAKRLGITIVETRPWDATRVDSNMVQKVDRVLVDVPCSGLGVIRRKPEIKYKKPFNLDGLPRIQLEILSAGAQYVKVGGVIVYSTCTINAHENQEVVEAFLKKNPMFKKEEAVQLLPNVNGTDGFYICKLRKDGGLL